WPAIALSRRAHPGTMAAVVGASVVIRLLCTAWVGCLVAMAAGAEPPAPSGEPRLSREQAERLFAVEVLPLLQNKCIACHGDDPKGPRGGLDLRSRTAALAGGDSGEPALVPGDPGKSLIVQAVAHDGLKMPPKENDR